MSRRNEDDEGRISLMSLRFYVQRFSGQSDPVESTITSSGRQTVLLSELFVQSAAITLQLPANICRATGQSGVGTVWRGFTVAGVGGEFTVAGVGGVFTVAGGFTVAGSWCVHCGW